MKAIVCCLMLLLAASSSFAQYPKKVSWGSRNVGNGIYFNIKGTIAEPFMGMQYVTYTFTNESNKQVTLYWTMVLHLSNGKDITHKHDWSFKPNETVPMGWAHTESDILDIKGAGGGIITSITNSEMRVEVKN
jgi:hypothetical protein